MNTTKPSILVVDDDGDTCRNLSDILTDLGYRVDTAQDGPGALELVRQNPYEVALLDYKMPEMDGIDAAAQIYRERPVPVILVSAFHDAELIARAEADHVLAYLVKPIKHADLEPTIALAMRRFEQFESLRQEAADLRQALDDRKVIERAKGILMKRSSFDEQEAFRRMQKLASEKSRKLIDIAHMILVAEEAAQPPAPLSSRERGEGKG